MRQPKTKRYLGMTVTQLAILGSLVGVMCVVMIGAYWVFASIAQTNILGMPVSNVGASPTILFAVPTTEPTQTPVPSATSTAIPYESLIPPGWKQVTSAEAPGMEIWLPTSFVPLKEIKGANLIPVFESDGTAQNGKTIISLADKTQTTYLIYTSFSIFTQPMSAATVDEMIDRLFGPSFSSMRVNEHSDFVFGSLTGRKLVFEINASSTNLGYSLYAVQIGDTVWYIVFNTAFNLLYTNMPVFDQAAHTFRVLAP